MSALNDSFKAVSERFSLHVLEITMDISGCDRKYSSSSGSCPKYLEGWQNSG